MKVFITDAIGYIGHAAAVAFAARGHQVSGLTRSLQRADRLSEQGIEPVIGSMQDPAAYLEAAAAVDVLVHAAVD